MARVITVFSNKGGVGKSFTSVNLATSLALSGHRTLLIDLDLQAGQDVARMLNLSPRYAMVHVLAEMDKSEDPELVKKYVTAHSSGLDFLPTVNQFQQIGDISSEKVKIFLRNVSLVYDYLVIDAGKSFSETLVTVMDHSNLILLVATPDILAVYQIRSALDVLQSLHFPMNMVKLVLNRAESTGGVAWQEVRSALPCEILSRIPSDGRVVGMALNRGIPCVIDSPKSRVSQAFSKMVSDFSKKDIFVEATEVSEKDRAVKDFFKVDNFWKKYGIDKKDGSAEVSVPIGHEAELINLKKKIHEKLVERLDLKDITPEALGDSKKAQRIRSSAEKIIGALLVEEAGAIISSHEERSKLVQDILDEALGLGPLEELLADPDVTDIMVTKTSEIYVEKHGKIILTNRKFISENQVRSVIDRIIAPLGRRIDESTPTVDARLPDGSRINAIIRPLSLNGPMITIRKFSKERLTIEDLLNRHQSLNRPMADFLNASVLARKNIVISGGTGAGKTTLLNVVSLFIPDEERIVTIEDAAELRLKANSHWARLESRASNIEGKGQVSIRDLFINSLRMRPDRIIIGECRGPEVLDMLQAMNTGHDGSLTTLHANSTRDVLVRMSSMILLSGIDLPLRAMYEMIATAIDIIVHVARFSDGSRRITGITEVAGIHDQAAQLDLKDIFVFSQKGLDKEGKVLGDYEPTGYIPQAYDDFVTRGIPIDKLIFSLSETS